MLTVGFSSLMQNAFPPYPMVTDALVSFQPACEKRGNLRI